jgi:hypothetical protein
MSIFLDTRGRSTLGIGVCDRCNRKMSIEDLYSDPNSPGLRVCLIDRDEYDPYRLPARQPERISLPFVRPDVPINTQPVGIVAENNDQFIVTSNNDEFLIPIENAQ